MSAKKTLLTLAVSGSLTLLLGALTVFAQGVTVPSGVPTEAPGVETTLDIPNTTVTVAGCAAPGAFVTFFDNDNPVGTVLASPQGKFSKKIIAPGPGIRNVKLFFDDVNGRTSSTLSKNISLAPHTNTTLNLLMPSTIEHEPEPVGSGGYLIFRGTTCPNALVNVIIGEDFKLAAQADPRGNWYIIADTEYLSPGKHSYRVISQVGTQISDPSQPYQFTVAGSGNSDVLPPGLLAPPVIVLPKDGFLTSTRNVSVIGTGPANTQIELFVDNNLIGSVFTNAIGEWLMTMTMQAPQHSLQARACQDDKCSDLSNLVRIYYSGPLDNCDLNFQLGELRFFDIHPDDGINLELTAASDRSNMEVIIDWGDSTIEHTTKEGGHPVSYHHVFSELGNFNGVVIVQDDEGCSEARYFSASVKPERAPQWLWLLLIPAAGLIIWLIARFTNIWHPIHRPLRYIWGKIKRFWRWLIPAWLIPLAVPPLRDQDDDDEESDEVKKGAQPMLKQNQTQPGKNDTKTKDK